MSSVSATLNIGTDEPVLGGPANGRSMGRKIGGGGTTSPLADSAAGSSSVPVEPRSAKPPGLPPAGPRISCRTRTVPASRSRVVLTGSIVARGRARARHSQPVACAARANCVHRIRAYRAAARARVPRSAAGAIRSVCHGPSACAPCVGQSARQLVQSRPDGTVPRARTRPARALHRAPSSPDPHRSGPEPRLRVGSCALYW